MTDHAQDARPGRHGIYIASKTRHADRWKEYRDKGFPIISTWIDEAGEGESADLDDLWTRCVAEASGCRVLIVYREPDDVLKGGWVEVGAALAAGVPVYAVGLEGFTIAKHRRLKHFPTIGDAFSAASWDCVGPTALPEGSRGTVDLDADIAEHRFYRDTLIEECAQIAEHQDRQMEWPRLEQDGRRMSPTARMQQAIAAAIRATALPSTERA